jgi:hypothetical protein
MQWQAPGEEQSARGSRGASAPRKRRPRSDRAEAQLPWVLTTDTASQLAIGLTMAATYTPFGARHHPSRRLRV